MEDLETRKARRIEQMVAKWLRRSRDHSTRGRASVSDRTSDGISQSPSHVKLTVDVQKDVLLGHYGFEVSQNLPLLITSVAAGSTADGKLLPGDHILAINNEAAEGVTGEQAAALLRESEDTLQFTVLRCTSGGPKSSFLTAEKRARLKTNPVKVHFAEEVVVNGHTQGSSLLCMPNVLKVYLENGQTKAFKFDSDTTVKDIILTLKEKLSIRSIDYFALVLEEQYNVLKMYLLHEDELIEQVVQRKESHDHRCLFRVSFMPRDPLELLQQDPFAFEYLYLQSCSDVLQERFAVEMKCSVALRLAALHIQERIITCAQPQKVSLKYIEKDWGIENFISPTLLRNMRGKDIKKAISFHMKRNQLLLDPRQKHLLSAAQVRLCYLQILGDLKLYGGRIFNATLMLQDRESCVALLVGAKYGISQVVNNKLNIITMLAEFANISRVELTEESEKVSVVKIFLQDIKLLTLLLESNNAKDLACLINGYYRLFVDSSSSIFVWGERKPQMHRFSTEEGYESRTCSDSEESSELDSSLDRFSDSSSPKHSSINPLLEDEGEQEELKQERKDPEDKGMSFCNGYDNTNDSLSEASDSANTESRGLKTSGSSDSMDALEEDDLEACSSSKPEFFHLYTPTLQELTSNGKGCLGSKREEDKRATQEYFFSFLLLPHLSNPALAQPDVESQRESEMSASALESKLAENNVLEYYSLCANISPASSGEKNTQSDSPESGCLSGLDRDEGLCGGGTRGFILAPPPSFGDTSSDDEFNNAAERVMPTETRAGSGGPSLQSLQGFNSPKVPSCCGLGEDTLSRQSRRTKHTPEKDPKSVNSLRKRRSFLQTNYTSQVTFPQAPVQSLEGTDHLCYGEKPVLSGPSCSPAVASLRGPNRDSDLLEARQIVQLAKNATPSPDFIEMEPDSLETKSVTDSVVCPVSAIRLQGVRGKESSDLTPSSFCTVKHDASFFSSCMPDHQSSSISRLGISFQLDDLNTPYKEKPGDLTETSSRVQERCLAEGEKILENTMGTAKALPETGVSYVLIEEIIHTSTKSASSLSSHQGKPLPYVPISDQDLLPTEKLEEEQLVQGPWKRVKGDPTLCEPSQALGGLQLQEDTSKVLSEGSLPKSEDAKQLGFLKATELLSNGDGASGIVTHLPWLAYSSVVGKTCQQTDNKDQRIVGQSVPVVDQVSLKEGVLNQGTCHLSVMTSPQNKCVSPDFAGGQKAERRDLTRDTSHVDYKYKLTSPLVAPTEKKAEQREAGISDGLEYFSLDILCKSAGPNEENSTSDPSFLHSDNPTDDTKAHMSSNTTYSPALMNATKVFSPKHKTDRCSCQLTYTSCFHGLDNEAELEFANPAACGTPEGPLTTPPSTRSPLSLDFNDTRLIQEHNYVNGNAKDCRNHVLLPESPVNMLSYLKDTMYASSFDFRHLLDNIVHLQDILRQFGGSKIKHPQDKCSTHLLENKNTLYMESQRLISSCQKVIKTHGPSSEMQNAVQETFQNLLQLTEMCFQFTNCGLCNRRHKDVMVNLKHVVVSYHQFVQAAKQACEKGYLNLSVKLLVCQYTALTAALFCLVQQFRVSPCV
ncbi:FERM and PDZ domain-containing protein 1 isoform X2 [Rhineura floridana]|uniref:FERM and PDZ domain-containing protein 1 isoform X2 n=1 Tax=Rhineura floridana TaxID=261503 RepID=UPI002AC88EAA|nr:FERM and PDZ domain-containing protein 1 isoform X2 [Rhineura floridana]